jgi:hypothetical protein
MSRITLEPVENRLLSMLPEEEIAAGRLQATGLVSYVRGRITILDRSGLEAAVCECYRVVKDEYDRLLG